MFENPLIIKIIVAIISLVAYAIGVLLYKKSFCHKDGKRVVLKVFGEVFILAALAGMCYYIYNIFSNINFNDMEFHEHMKNMGRI